MSYYASCRGTLTFKKLTPLEKEREAKSLRQILLLKRGNYTKKFYDLGWAKLLEEILCNLQPYGVEMYCDKSESPSRLCVDFYGYEKYNYYFEEFLEAITPAVFSGSLEFSSEDGYYWRFRFHGDEFHEESGELIFEGDGYVGPQSYRSALENTVTLDGKNFVILSEGQLREMGFQIPEV